MGRRSTSYPGTSSISNITISMKNASRRRSGKWSAMKRRSPRSRRCTVISGRRARMRKAARYSSDSRRSSPAAGSSRRTFSTATARGSFCPRNIASFPPTRLSSITSGRCARCTHRSGDSRRSRRISFRAARTTRSRQATRDCWARCSSTAPAASSSCPNTGSTRKSAESIF
jgi:hypothetical protein